MMKTRLINSVCIIEESNVIKKSNSTGSAGCLSSTKRAATAMKSGEIRPRIWWRISLRSGGSDLCDITFQFACFCQLNEGNEHGLSL